MAAAWNKPGVRARSGGVGGTNECGGGGDVGGRTPFVTFLEQALERETLLFSNDG